MVSSICLCVVGLKNVTSVQVCQFSISIPISVFVPSGLRYLKIIENYSEGLKEKN